MFEIFNKTHNTMNTALGVLDSLFIRYFKPLKIKSNHVEKNISWFMIRRQETMILRGYEEGCARCGGGEEDNK